MVKQAYAQEIAKPCIARHSLIEERRTAKDAVDLYSTQEETDTRMFLHTSHASADGHHCTAVLQYSYQIQMSKYWPATVKQQFLSI